MTFKTDTDYSASDNVPNQDKTHNQALLVKKAVGRGRTQAILVLGIVTVLFLLAQLGYLAYQGVLAMAEKDKPSPILQVRGPLVSIKSFEVFGKDGVVSFKYLWLIKVEEYESVAGLETQLPKLKSGDTISVEIKDSRANLFVTSQPTSCYRAEGSAVRVCDYEISKSFSYATVFITEFKSDSSGQYELSGTPR